MKNINIIAALVFTFVLFSLSATAQKDKVKLDINYNYSIPSGKFKSDLVHDNSLRGFNANLMYAFNNKWQAGLAFGYQDYYQKYPRTIYSLSKTQDVSAVLTNSIQTVPFLLTAQYSPLTYSFIEPYISAGAGVNVVNFKQYLGEFGGGATDAAFIAQGGLGAKFPFGQLKTSGIDVGANYSFSPYKKYDYHDLNSVNIYAGIFFNIK